MSPASQQAQDRRNREGVRGQSFPQIMAGIEAKTSLPKGLVYSRVPIKQVGPNKRVGWIFYVSSINVQAQINE